MSHFNIGDRVFYASFGREEYSIPCLDCGGTRTMRVTLFDGQEFVIPCAGCARGYEPPTGYVKQIRWSAKAEARTVTGVQIHANGYGYHFEGGWIDTDGDRTLATEAGAAARAEELRQKYEDEENKRLRGKTKDERSWAWHVHYHRSCLKDAERKIKYHSEMLGIAKDKAKQTAEVES